MVYKKKHISVVGIIKLPNDHRQQVYQNGTLIIKSIDKNVDASIYRCEAETHGFNKPSREFNLRVLGKTRYITILGYSALAPAARPRLAEWDKHFLA